MSKPSQEAPRIGILTISDRATRGIYEDLSGPAIEKALREFLATECVYERRMVVDEIPEFMKPDQAKDDEETEAERSDDSSETSRRNRQQTEDE